MPRGDIPDIPQSRKDIVRSLAAFLLEDFKKWNMEGLSMVTIFIDEKEGSDMVFGASTDEATFLSLDLLIDMLLNRFPDIATEVLQKAFENWLIRFRAAETKQNLEEN